MGFGGVAVIQGVDRLDTGQHTQCTEAGKVFPADELRVLDPPANTGAFKSVKGHLIGRIPDGVDGRKEPGVPRPLQQCGPDKA